MTPFRQSILPGDVGSDVRAVKRAMQRMGVHGSGGMILDTHAGQTFVQCLHIVQRNHHVKSDGVYGPSTHGIIAPHFDAYGVFLYRKASIRSRKPPEPPLYIETAKQAASELLRLHADGLYRADNPGDLNDIADTALGKPVWSQMGRYVYLDSRPLRLLLLLIKRHSYRLGTFALCSDHHYDGPHGHSGGLAVDISSIDGHSLAGGGSHDLAHAVVNIIRADSHLRPRQLIVGGTGYVFYSDLEALCVPSAAFYGYQTLSEHRNHIHAGY